MTIHPDLKNDFWDQGVYFPIKVLEKEELDYFRNTFFEHEAILEGAVKYSSFAQLHLHFPWAYQLATHPRILEVMKTVLGPNVLVHGSTIFHKHPNDQKFVSWHQDSYNMKLKNFEYVTAWLALEDSIAENGCLRVIPKTHKELYDHQKLPEQHNLLVRGLTVDVSEVEQNAVDVELKAGEISLHHVNLIHGSKANVSGQRRIGFAIRYISSNVSQGSFHHPVILAAGDYGGTHYDVLEKPPSGTLEECIEKQSIAHAAYAEKINLPKVENFK